MGEQPDASRTAGDVPGFDFSRLLREVPERVRFSAGSVIFAEGDPAELMYLVVDGEVRVAMHGEPMAMEQAGGFFGEMALIDGRRRSATATALTDCELAPLDREAFLDLLRKHPEFALHVMSTQADRLRLANEIVSSI